ncbi:NAD(P)-dependent oxidoreductase [Candidatus Gottesmanbacteria bacterium]|nr:NAD(P)-dependent oxidoreductase [Candidatus Gottesmanbacteria bacterium]
MKIPILGTGLSGLVGSRIMELLGDTFEFTDLSFATGIDITNSEQVVESFQNSSASIVLHMAAKTDVDACEDDKIFGEEGPAWLVNVIGTQNIVEAAKKFNKRLVYISTDFVFDGTQDSYAEDDTVNPLNWYGYTKSEGEKLVKEAEIRFMIVRLSYPFRAYYKEKADFVRRIIEKAEKKEKLFALTDHIFTPTFIDDIASALDLILKKELQGVYHVVGGQSLTPHDAIHKILTKFGLATDVESVTREVFFKNRAFRPRNLALKNDKITKLGIKMKSFDEGLSEIEKQIHNKLI